MRENVVRLYEHGKDQLAEALGAKEHPEQREFLRLAGEMVLSFTDGLNLQVLMNPDADYGPVISLFQDMLYRTLAPVLGLDDPAETVHLPLQAVTLKMARRISHAGQFHSVDRENAPIRRSS